jgi:hypothetical protein
MKRILMGVLMVLIFCGVALADNRGVAIVKSVQGDVKLKRAGRMLEVKPGDHLQSGDLLVTGKQGRTGIIFHDGSVLTLDQKSMLRIKEFVFVPIEKKFKFNLIMKKGSALFESGKISKLSPDMFRFEIPEGTIGIRGTKFLVEVR